MKDFPASIDLKDEDIYEAMQGIPGYLDITPGDFKEVYHLAFQHALERLSRAVTAAEIMTTDVVAVKPDTPVADVAAAMGRRGGVRGARGRRRPHHAGGGPAGE